MKTDVNLLRTLVAIFETGSVSAAARRLGLSQPATSAALSRLRAAMTDPLFVRNGSRMDPTPRAIHVIGRAREVLQVVDQEILCPPSFSPEEFEGELTLCMSEIGESVFLPGLFKRIRQDAPRARLRTRSLPPEELEGALAQGQVDSVLGYFPDLKSGSVFQKLLYSHDLTCLVRRDHAIKGSKLTLKEFLELEHVLVKDGGRTQEMFEKQLATRRIERRIALQTSHYMSLSALLEDTDLTVVLPRAIAELYAANSSLRVIDPPFVIGRYELKQYWHRRFHHDPRSQWLRGVIQDVLAKPAS